MRAAAVLLVLGGLLLGSLAPGCTPPPQAPAYREEPVWSEADFRRRHERMLYHVLEQPGETRRALEHAEQRAFEYDLAAWEAIARRQEQIFARIQARKRINTVYFDRLQERIRRDQAERRRRKAEQTAAFLEQAERLGVLQRNTEQSPTPAP